MITNAMRECIRLCWECRHSCQETLFSHCLPIGGVHMEEQHVKLMVDCIQLCQAAADFMTRGSSMHGIVCKACAYVCEACAKTCEQIGDESMMRCVEACRACAQSCRTMDEVKKAA